MPFFCRELSCSRNAQNAIFPVFVKKVSNSGGVGGARKCANFTGGVLGGFFGDFQKCVRGAPTVPYPGGLDSFGSDEPRSAPPPHRTFLFEGGSHPGLPVSGVVPYATGHTSKTNQVERLERYLTPRPNRPNFEHKAFSTLGFGFFLEHTDTNTYF